MTDVLLYANLPCHSSNGPMCLNLRIEKSDAKAAYIPSLPTIPTPTSAAYIIATSFPPSPIERHIFPVYNLIASVTSAFYVGEHLQHTTAGAAHDTIKKLSLYYSIAILSD